MGFFLATLLQRILKQKEETQQNQMEAAVREELIEELKLDIDQPAVQLFQPKRKYMIR